MPYHQNSYDIWDIVIRKSVPVMVFANGYNPRRSRVQTPFVVRNKDWYFQGQLCNGSCGGLRNAWLHHTLKLNILRQLTCCNKISAKLKAPCFGISSSGCVILIMKLIFVSPVQVTPYSYCVVLRQSRVFMLTWLMSWKTKNKILILWFSGTPYTGIRRIDQIKWIINQLHPPDIVIQLDEAYVCCLFAQAQLEEICYSTGLRGR
jgi:hypothetical protein